MMRRPTNASSFWRMILLCSPSILPIFIVFGGKWNCFSNGSCNTCGSKSFLEPLKMRSRPKSELPCPSMFSSPFSKKRLRLEHSLYTILQVLSITLLEKQPILELFTEPDIVFQPISDQDRFPLFEGLEQEPEDSLWM